MARFFFFLKTHFIVTISNSISFSPQIPNVTSNSYFKIPTILFLVEESSLNNVQITLSPPKSGFTQKAVKMQVNQQQYAVMQESHYKKVAKDLKALKTAT
jgi:hypothetical protein